MSDVRLRYMFFGVIVGLMTPALIEWVQGSDVSAIACAVSLAIFWAVLELAWRQQRRT